MATIRKVVRVANPRRKRVYRTAKGRFTSRRTTKSNPKRKRRSSSTAKRKSPVIRRYTVKALKKELRRRGMKANPSSTTRRRRNVRRTHRRSTVRRSNPVLIELGAVNPRRRRKNVASKRKSHSRRRVHRTARRTHHRRRRNPEVITTTRRRRRVRVYNRRKRNTTHHRRTHHRRHHYRRNPALFGKSGGKDLLTMVGGGLVGVAATKFLPTMLPASLVANLGGSPLMGVVITGAGAFVASYLARMVFKDHVFADSVLFGGLMQTASGALNAFAPSSIAGSLALSGMGDIVPGWYAVPQNPITNRAPVAVIPAPGSSTGSGASGMGAMRRFGNYR